MGAWPYPIGDRWGLTTPLPLLYRYRKAHLPEACCRISHHISFCVSQLLLDNVLFQTCTYQNANRCTAPNQMNCKHAGDIDLNRAPLIIHFVWIAHKSKSNSVGRQCDNSWLWFCNNVYHVILKLKIGWSRASFMRITYCTCWRFVFIYTYFNTIDSVPNLSRKFLGLPAYNACHQIVQGW